MPGDVWAHHRTDGGTVAPATGKRQNDAGSRLARTSNTIIQDRTTHHFTLKLHTFIQPRKIVAFRGDLTGPAGH